MVGCVSFNWKQFFAAKSVWFRGGLFVALYFAGLGFGFSCSLFAALDLLQVVTAAGGTGTWSLVLPNDPSLSGVHLWNQVIEIGAVSAASNGGEGEIR